MAAAWYVVDTEQASDPAGGEVTRPDVPQVGWCAWYGDVAGATYAAVRAPAPMPGVDTVPVGLPAVLAAAGYSEKPYGRIQGQ